jgi:hypothetical protein
MMNASFSGLGMKNVRTEIGQTAPLAPEESNSLAPMGAVGPWLSERVPEGRGQVGLFLTPLGL